MIELAVCAVQVMVKLDSDGAHPEFSPAGIDQHRHMCRIPVVDVVRRELKMPAELAGVAIQAHQRTGIEVVAPTSVAVVVGSRIAGSPIDQVEYGVLRAGDPRRRAAGLPTLAPPRFMSPLTRARDRPEAPHPPTGLPVVRVQQPANAEFAACDCR